MGFSFAIEEVYTVLQAEASPLFEKTTFTSLIKYLKGILTPEALSAFPNRHAQLYSLIRSCDETAFEQELTRL